MLVDVSSLIFNLALLVALNVAAGYLSLWKRGREWMPVAQGLLFGAVMVLGMTEAVELQKGVIYDGRSVVASLSGLFFGPVAAGIAAGIGISYRAFTGGAGTIVGVLMIAVSAALGVAFHQRSRRRQREFSPWFLLGFGLVVQLAMLALLYFLPGDLFFNVLPRVFWTVLVMYPGATVLLGKFLSDQRSRSRHLNELQQSREALKTTLYSIGDAVVATDAAGRVQQMNEVAEQLTGWPEPEALGKRLDEVLTIVDEETGQPMESPVAKVLRLGRKVDLADNALLVSRGQERRPIADSAAPIRDAAGQMTGVVLVFRDQTGTRTTQRKLAESEQRYRALADSGQGLIWTCDANRQFDYFNRPWLQFTGRTLAEECGTGWLEAVHPEDRDRCWAIYCQAFEQRETFSMVYRLRRRDGAYRRVQNDGTPQYGAEGEFLGYIGHCLDITEHLEMREWYGTLFREMTGGLAMHRVDPSANGTSRHYRFMAVNPAFERLTGLRTAELLGQRLATVLPGLAERWTEVYDRVARTGAPVELEHFGPIMGHHFRLTAYQPSPGHFATILMDITERVQVAAERQRNQQRLSCLAEVLQHPCNSVKEFLDFALEQALRLTGSAIGYIYHYSEERQELVLNSWSKSVMASCGIENPKYCRELSTTGLWGETVRQRKPIIVNDYAAPNRLKHGYPEGHAELRNYLTVPVIIEGRIVGVVAVANKATDYRREDVRQLRLLFDAVWKEVGRKEAEESLRASERQYRLLFERAPVGIFKIDSTGEGLQFNPALAGMLGCKTPEEAQLYCQDADTPALCNSAAWRDLLSRTGQEGIQEDYELEARTIDGRQIWVSINTRVGDVAPDGTYVIEGFATDITERKHAALALAESERRVRQKLDAILLPEGDIGSLDLADVIDVSAVQSMMDDFYTLAGIGVALLDLNGGVLASAGWLDRACPFGNATTRTCSCHRHEQLAADNVESGAWRSCRTLDLVREVSTPILVGGLHLGDLVMGQFLFADDTVDRERVYLQAKAHGLPAEDCLATLDQLPRWTRQTVAAATGFYSKFAELASTLSYSNIKLARTLSERDDLLGSLRESEARWRSYLDGAPYGVFATNADWVIRQVNTAACHLTGQTEDGLLGRKATDLFPDQSAPAVQQHLDRLRRDGHAEDELLFRHASGELRWASLATVRISADTYLGFAADVTERKRAQDQLQRIKWMLSKGLPSTNAQMLIADDGPEEGQEGLILRSVGREMLADIALEHLDLLGTSSTICEANGDYALHILASDWCRLVSGASRACSSRLCRESGWTDCCREAIRTGLPVDVGCHCGIRHYGVPIFVHGKPIGAINFAYGDPPQDNEALQRIARASGVDADALRAAAEVYDSRPPYIVEMARDRLAASAKLIGSMVEAKLAGDALAESELNYRTFINSSRDLVSYKDDQLRYRLVNEALCRFAGLSEAEIEGKTDEEIMPRAMAEYSRRTDQEALRNRAVSVSRAAVNGRTYESRKFPVRLPDGKLGVGGFIRDVTDLVNAEEERELLEKQLLHAQKMEVVGRLAGGVAHDFNNQLMGILGYAELCQDMLEPGTDLADWLQEIIGAAERSADLTRQLLAFARKQAIVPKVIDLNKAVTSTLGMLRRLIGEDISLAWLPGPRTCTIKVDPSQVDQILSNLAVNARDAITGVGQVTIQTDIVTLDDAFCMEHPGSRPGTYAMVAVSDDGCGMDKETVSHVFEPFFTTKEVGQGTGLGLATVYGIVKQNEGTVYVYSEPGQGTTFRIYLPQYVEEKADAALPARTEKLPEGDETILLVEDERTVLHFGQLTLERLGYTVLAASAPEHAIRLARDHEGTIHLLLTDVVMPEMNGRELRDRLAPERPEMKCMFMSGYTAETIARRGILEDDVRLLEKPFTRLRLAEAVREALAEA